MGGEGGGSSRPRHHLIGVKHFSLRHLALGRKDARVHVVTAAGRVLLRNLPHKRVGPCGTAALDDAEELSLRGVRER
eukprot:768471-Hanusia_phi.AAC.4